MPERHQYQELKHIVDTIQSVQEGENLGSAEMVHARLAEKGAVIPIERVRIVYEAFTRFARSPWMNVPDIPGCESFSRSARKLLTKAALQVHRKIKGSHRYARGPKLRSRIQRRWYGPR